MDRNSDPTRAIDVFFSYAHEDECMRGLLQKHLAMLRRENLITSWHDRQIRAGTEWASEIDEHINSADVILLLVSVDFLASGYEMEMRYALNRHEAGEARVLPVILRPCDWYKAPFGKLQALPKDAKPISKWEDRDEAFLSVVNGIRKAVEDITNPHEVKQTHNANRETTEIDSQPSISTTRWLLVLDATIDDVNRDSALAIINSLQHLLNDHSLKLVQMVVVQTLRVADNQRHASILTLFVSWPPLRPHDHHSLRPLVYHLQAQLSRLSGDHG